MRMSQPTAARDLSAAARATLAAGAARVCRRRFSGAGELVETEVGEADLLACRVRIDSSAGPVLQQLGESMAERWPWLGEESEPDTSVSVYAGTAQYFGFENGHWTAIVDGDPAARQRVHTDPVWILEALSRAQVTAAGRRGVEDVRGEQCERHGFEVTLAHTDAPLQLPPHRGATPPRLIGEAWIDRHDLVRRITWRRKTFVRRPRSPGGAPTTTGSQTVELWDFGLATDIPIPDLPRRPPGAALVDLVQTWRRLSRRRREYERR